VFTVNFLDAVKLEPVSENTMNTGNTPPLVREALYVFVIDGLRGLT
jgi:hypothetical protein